MISNYIINIIMIKIVVENLGKSIGYLNSFSFQNKYFINKNINININLLNQYINLIIYN